VGLAALAALRGCVAAGPVLVAVDDVQWLDEASRAALAFALQRISAGPLSVLLAARSEASADPLTADAPAPSHGWRDLLAAVPVAEVIDLAPLDMWQVRACCRGALLRRRRGWWPTSRAGTRSGRWRWQRAWIRPIVRCPHWRGH
jgi:hypothetical protein